MKDNIEFLGELERSGLYLNENLGQHFLVDSKAIATLANLVVSEVRVIEVGSGIGHITKELATRAGSVVGVELDRRFQPYLDEVVRENKRISFVYGDVLKMNLPQFIPMFGGAQVMANLPFHITEPFLSKLVGLKIENAVLLLGDSAAQELEENENSLSFGKMSLVAQTFFYSNTVMHVDRSGSYPQSRTDASLVVLEPKSKKEIGSNPADFIFAELIRKERKNGLVINDLKQAIVELKTSPIGSSLSKREFHQRDRANTRRELRRLAMDCTPGDYKQTGEIKSGGGKVVSQSTALRVIEEMGISDSIINQPFFRLDNQDLRILVAAVRTYYR